MARCEDCIHEKLCVIKAFPDAFENTAWDKEPCNHFKDKSLYVELPCKVGDVVFVVGSKCMADLVDCAECDQLTWENPGLDCDECPFNKKDIVFQRVADTRFMSTLVFGTNEDYIFGKTVFLTKEEAEKALAERSE